MGLTTTRERLERLRSTVRPLFHWKFSQAVIPVLFGTGVGMALGNKFYMGYAFFVFFGLWTVAYWLTSDFLAKKRRQLGTRSTRNNNNLLIRRSREYLMYRWGGCALVFLMSSGFIWWTLGTKHQYERDDTFQHLTVNYSIPVGLEDDPMSTVFTVTNGGNYQISRLHGITCLTNLAVGNGGTSSIERSSSGLTADGKMWLSGLVHTFDIGSSSAPLVPGGDAQSDQCLRS